MVGGQGLQVCSPRPATCCLLWHMSSLPSLDPRGEAGREGEVLLPGTQDSRTFLDGHGVKLDHEHLLSPSHSRGWKLLRPSNL